MSYKKSIKILALETSCDETAAAVVVDGPASTRNGRRGKAGKIKSNIIASQAFKLHAKYGGVVPEVAAREHTKIIIPTINLALKTARVKIADIDYIAVTQGPGLATSLMVGVDTALSLGLGLNKPVLPVNHLEGHIYANLVKSKPSFPALVLTVSGGHTFLTEMKKHGQYRLLGETVDDAAGEAFDKTARMLGLGYPGGAELSRIALKGNPSAFNVPRPMINSGNFNFSFSGLKTSVLYTIQKLTKSGKKLDNKTKANLAASVQQAIVDVLIAKLEKAIIQYKPRTIMLGGGVAANKPLRERFIQLANKHNLSASIPAFEYCTDNAAMIGLAAYYRISAGGGSASGGKNKKAKFSKGFSAKPNLPLK